MSTILSTERGTYDLSKRNDVYAYFCQNFGMKGDDLSLLERFILKEPEQLKQWRSKDQSSIESKDHEIALLKAKLESRSSTEDIDRAYRLGFEAGAQSIKDEACRKA